MNAIDMLAREQQALLQALLGECDDSSLGPHLQPGWAHAPLARRGLQAYQANGLALAERALGAAYPVLAQLIGDESFAPLARHFWRRHPFVRGDVACWGDGLAAFIEAAPQLADEPYLGDVARIEWALHQAATAADAQPDPHSFALLSAADPAEVTLTLGAGVFLLASAYPVASIVNAHLLGAPALAEAAALLRAGAAEYALIWRQGFKPRVRSIIAAEHALLTALRAGSSLQAALGYALDDAPATTPESAAAFSFEHWLGQAVQEGLVTGAHRLVHSTSQASHPADAEPFQLSQQPRGTSMNTIHTASTNPAGFWRRGLGFWELLTRSLDSLQPLAALLARLYIAQVFFLSGLTKLRDWEITVALFIDEYKVPLLPPGLAAAMGTAGEIALPVLLVLGLGGRFSPLGLFVVNAVAVISLGEIAPAALQQHVFWGSLLAGLAVYGLGPWSLDRFVAPRLLRRD